MKKVDFSDLDKVFPSVMSPTNKEYIKENLDEIKNIINYFETIGSEVDNKEFNETFDMLSSINPNTRTVWEIVSTGVNLCAFTPYEWYMAMDWERFLNIHRNDISEIIDYFTETLPKYFE